MSNFKIQYEDEYGEPQVSNYKYSSVKAFEDFMKSHCVDMNKVKNARKYVEKGRDD